ncbi:MAG: redoxin domain-containing protein [Candidatus Kapabacteria bacterium]|nr:redoxin domain-containing protein [Candidatus Kapabacteria bacterium]
MTVDVGAVAPDFSLVDADKATHTLSDYRGKNVVLAFYPGAFTGVCDKEVCSLRDSMARFNDMNAQVLGISVDGPFALKEFSNKYQLNFPVLADFQRTVTNQYGLLFPALGGVAGYDTSNRAVVILDKEGVVRYTWVASPNPGVEPDYDEVLNTVASL